MSGNIRPQSSQLAEPQWTDSGVKSGISMREPISTLKKKRGVQAGNEWSNILPKSSQARKNSPPPPPHPTSPPGYIKGGHCERKTSISGLYNPLLAYWESLVSIPDPLSSVKLPNSEYTLCSILILFYLPRREAGNIWCLPRLKSQGCHLIPLYDLFSCSSAYSCCSFCLVFFSTGPFS